MTVDPPYVKNGTDAVLGCHYDLQGKPLLSVKWYRGTFEFYRYSPADKPPQKTFRIQGMDVEVSEILLNNKIKTIKQSRIAVLVISLAK